MKLKKIIMLLILALAWSIPACADEVKDNSDSTREWLNEKEDNGSQPKEETLTTEDQKDAERFREMQKELDEVHSESWDERIDR